MRLIGYWIDSLSSEYFAPQEFVGPLESALRVKVSDYLDQGEKFRDFRGRSWCRFLCKGKGACRELTDGEWVWPEDLGHYVRDHGIVLPREFMERARLGGLVPVKETWGETGVQIEFWKDWCRTHQAGRLTGSLARARHEADEAYRQKIFSEIARREAEAGLGNQKCEMQGCSRLALATGVFCAEHLEPIDRDDGRLLIEALRGPIDRS